MDILDRAQEIEQQQREYALRAARVSPKPSSIFCEDCGIEIPVKRREIGGITRCIDCQNIHESGRQHRG